MSSLAINTCHIFELLSFNNHRCLTIGLFHFIDWQWFPKSGSSFIQLKLSILHYSWFIDKCVYSQPNNRLRFDVVWNTWRNMCCFSNKRVCESVASVWNSGKHKYSSWLCWRCLLQMHYHSDRSCSNYVWQNSNNRGVVGIGLLNVAHWKWLYRSNFFILQLSRSIRNSRFKFLRCFYSHLRYWLYPFNLWRLFRQCIYSVNNKHYCLSCLSFWSNSKC